MLDARRRGPVPDVTFESFERVGVALGRDLDAAVGEIPHPAVQPFVSGRFLGKETKPDALNTSTDDVASRESQGRL